MNGDDLGAVDEAVEVGQVELAVGRERDPAQLDAALGGELVPGDDVGVVLHVCEHDDVAGGEVGPTPRVDDEVERLGGVLGEHDLVGVAGVDEAGDLGPSGLVGVGGIGGEAVGTAVDRGVAGLGELAHGVDDALRLLRRVGRVEVVDRGAVELALEQRELRLDGGGVELGGDVDAHAATTRKAS